MRDGRPFDRRQDAARPPQAELAQPRIIQEDLCNFFVDSADPIRSASRCEFPGTVREFSANLDRQASATKQQLLPWSLPSLMCKTVSFFVSFHRRAMQAWILFLVSIELGSSRRACRRRPWLSDMSQLGGAPCRFLARPGCGTRRCVGPTRARGKEGDSLGRTTPGVSHPYVPIQPRITSRRHHTLRPAKSSRRSGPTFDGTVVGLRHGSRRRDR